MIELVILGVLRFWISSERHHQPEEDESPLLPDL